MKIALNVDSYGPEEREAAKRVIDSGRYTMGSEVAHFEDEFADYLGVP